MSTPLEEAVLASLPRSPEELDAAIDTFHVESNPELLKHDANGDGIPDTFCNIFAQKLAKEMGCPLPEVRANDLAVWFKGKQAADQGWQQCLTIQEAKIASAKGEVVFPVYFNPKGHPGHIAVLRPDGTYAQAGGHNYARGTLGQCFGNLPVTYWHHR